MMYCLLNYFWAATVLEMVIGSSKSPSGRPGGLGSEVSTPDEPQAPAGPEPLFPLVMPMETLQGGKTVRTCELELGGSRRMC